MAQYRTCVACPLMLRQHRTSHSECVARCQILPQYRTWHSKCVARYADATCPPHISHPCLLYTSPSPRDRG
eukprot:3695768-Rhodomonas_salina.1